MTESSDVVQESSMRQLFVAVLLTAAGFALIAILVAVFVGRPGVEKYLTRLVQPVGVSFGLLVMTCVALLKSGHRNFAILAAISMLLIGVFGNESLAGLAMRQVESQIAWPPGTGVDSGIVAPFDVVVVLGGGVKVRPDGAAGGNRNADRLIRAASLYHAGRVKQFVATGERIVGYTRLDRDESTLTKEVLVSLGVPADTIIESSGRNTAEEFQALASSLEAGQRIGVVTSAKHMPRVQRIARAQGLSIVPVPADFRSSHATSEAPVTPTGFRIISIIPTAAALELSSAAIHEWLASIAGR